MVNTRTAIAPPKPKWSKVEDGHGEARFDSEELGAYLQATSDQSWIVKDEAGEVVGVANVALMREAFTLAPTL